MTTFHTAQSLLKRVSLVATMAIGLSGMTVRSVQAQTARRSQTNLAPVAKITFVRGEPERIVNKKITRKEVECPQGTLVIGGGREVSPVNVNDAFIKDSYPRKLSESDPYPRFWVSTGINLTDGPVLFSAYAICVQVSHRE
jgi:hypothetical protein